jgi:uncharacterized protein YbaR (Trm112 family)
MALSADLLTILRCPKCRGGLEERNLGNDPGLACAACRLFYPIVDDVPNFLVEDARPLG